MRIGIVSEGKGDRAVITNILVGLLEIDSSDIEPLRPQDHLDETDKAAVSSVTFGGWQGVKQECESRIQIDEFLAVKGQDYIVIHLDSAEADQFPVNRPSKTAEYCSELRARIISKINSWLKEDISGNLLYAIAIEEIEAWILTIYDTGNSASSAKPKEKLSRVLGRLDKNSSSNYANFLQITKPFSQKKQSKKKEYYRRNCSLNAFIVEVQSKVLNQ